MFLFLRRPLDLDKEEQGVLLQLRQSSSELELVYTLTQEFATMLRTRDFGEPGCLVDESCGEPDS